MAGSSRPGDQYLLAGGVCKVECIIVDDRKDNEEDTLFVSVGRSSVASQTEPQYFNTSRWNIPGVPIFYCGQPSPGTATTQCYIPHAVDACVGTDPTGPCSAPNQGTHRLHQPPTSTTAVPSTKNVDGDVVKTEVVKVSRHEPIEDRKQEPCRAKLPSITAAKIKTATHSLPPPTHMKRGRKKKVICHREEKKKSSLRISPVSAKISGKRRRRKKQDDEYEYDLGDSEGETDQVLRAEYDDTDEDCRSEKEQSDDNSEKDAADIESFRSKKLKLEASREASSLSDLKDGDEGEDTEYKPLINDMANYDASSEEYDDEYDCKGDVFSKSIRNNSEKSNRVMTVGINDLGSENNTSRQLRKYSEKAKQKYHLEKAVKENGRVMYRCLKCSEEFELRTQLKEHRKVHAAKARMYECSHCDKVFTDARKYYSHLGYHKQIFACQPCGRRFSLLGNLKKHLSTHESAPDQVCEVCGHQFPTKDQLQHHHQTQHQDDSVPKYKEECEHCGKKYVREEAYKQHLSGAPYNCSLCQVSVGCETKLKTHVRNEHGRCVCEFCGKSYKKNSLIHHIKIVHQEACVPCPHCPKKFTYRSKMLDHLDSIHSQEKKYKCALCDYTARTVNTLNLHRRRRHQDPALSPQYGCKLCTRKFHLPSKLTLHYRVHTGEKPFPCQSCGKAFANKYNRAEHERCVHGERMLLRHPDGSSSVKVIKHRRAPRAPGRRCELCGLDLPTSWAMVTHMKEQHNAQTLSKALPEEDVAVGAQKGETGTGEGDYEVNGEQCEAVGDRREQDLLLGTTPDVVSIPEYATHVEIDGVEYQVLRQ